VVSTFLFLERHLRQRAQILINQRRGTANARTPSGGVGGNSSIVSWWLARSSHARCIRSKSARSDGETAFAAKVPHAAA
jgi:hypothetical protein